MDAQSAIERRLGRLPNAKARHEIVDRHAVLIALAGGVVRKSLRRLGIAPGVEIVSRPAAAAECRRLLAALNKLHGATMALSRTAMTEIDRGRIAPARFVSQLWQTIDEKHPGVIGHVARVVAALGKSKSSRGAPGFERKARASSVARAVYSAYVAIVGEAPSLGERKEALGDAADNVRRVADSRFVTLLADVYKILGLKASAAAQAKAVISANK